MSATRRKVYRAGSILGDVEAVASGSPVKIVKRAGRKWIGRRFVSKLWRALT